VLIEDQRVKINISNLGTRFNTVENDELGYCKRCPFNKKNMQKYAILFMAP
jgi:hypothetical protein